MDSARGCLVYGPLGGLLLWLAIGAAALLLLGCTEPPVPDPVTELPEACEWPWVLDLSRECRPSLVVLR